MRSPERRRAVPHRLRRPAAALLLLTAASCAAARSGDPSADSTPSVPASSIAPLDERGLANAIAFTRLYGYVRFFHPAERAAAIDWDSFAVDGFRRVEAAPDADALARVLREVFTPIAPDVRVFTTDGRDGPRPPVEAPDPATHAVTYWHHEGVRTWPTEAPWQEVYRSGVAIHPLRAGAPPAGVPDPRDPMHAELGGGVAAWVPLARYVPAAADTAEWHPVEIPPDTTLSAEDRAVRFAAVALVWNLYQHFYPYFDVVPADWPAALETALRGAATDSTPRAFEQTLRRLLAGAHDGHGWADLLPYPPFGGVPIRAWWIEDRLTVVAVDDSVADRVRPGDVIVSIDGRSSEAAFAALRPFITGATDGWVRFAAMGQLLGGAPGSETVLELRDGTDRAAEVRRVRFVRGRRGFPVETRPEKVARLPAGLMYVDLSRATDDDFAAAIPALSEARGIVFDLRGYPRLDTRVVMAHLTDSTMRTDMGQVPLVRRPDRRGMDLLPPDTASFRIEPATPRLTSNVAFLTDERAISYSESTLSMVEGFDLGVIVGSPTAGTNGTNNPVRVPGGYRVTWTTMLVLKHDGSRLHGIGILPDVPVARTIRGVSEGRDEVLERAIQLLGGHDHPNARSGGSRMDPGCTDPWDREPRQGWSAAKTR